MSGHSFSRTLGGLLAVTPPALLARAWSRFLVDHEREPEAALPGATHSLETSAGRVTVYEAGEGARPVVLLHGIHAAASAADMRPLFARLAETRHVLAPDLPGFGLSDRVAARYTPDTYVNAISELIVELGRDQPVDLVALSLSAEYAARAAARTRLVHTLTLLSPTGFGTPHEQAPIERDAREGRTGHLSVLRTALGDQALYDLLVSAPSIRYFLRKSSVRGVDAELARYADLTSHRPGARHAPLAFASGALFPQGNPLEAYAAVRCPMLVLYDRDGYTGFGQLESFARRSLRVELARLSPSQGLPHFERPNTVLEVMREFWERRERETSRRERTSSVRISPRHVR